MAFPLGFLSLPLHPQLPYLYTLLLPLFFSNHLLLLTSSPSSPSTNPPPMRLSSKHLRYHAASRRDDLAAVIRRSKRRGRKRAAMSPRPSVHTKVRELQRLVPGGDGVLPDQLLMHTANYIFRLRLQLRVLRTLCKLYLE